MKKFDMKMIAAYLIPLLFAGNAIPVFAQDVYVKAKVGILIQSGHELKRAGSHEIVKPASNIRIYVHPVENSYVYVIHSDDKIAGLMNKAAQEFRGETLCLPSEQTYYDIDGKSPVVRFTIVCSPNKLLRLSDMIDADMAYDKWAEIEKEFNKESAIELTRKPEPAIEIAGSIRWLGDIKDKTLFVKDLPIYSGKGLLIKTYEFKVQK